MLTIIDKIKKELSIDDNGNVSCSIRGTARLSGVSAQALSKQFKGVNIKQGK